MISILDNNNVLKCCLSLFPWLIHSYFCTCSSRKTDKSLHFFEEKNKLRKLVEHKIMKNIISILVLMAGTVMASPWLPAVAAEPKDTNVLLITIDTIRADRLGCYGSDRVKTPHIDALAEKGALFTHAFAHNPMTLPSHTNILLGITPLYHGVHENSKALVAEKFVTLAEFLKDKGYATGAFIGAFPLNSRFGLAQGFEVYDESYPSKPSETLALPERRADKVIAAAQDWLGKQHTKWFAWIHLWDPHAPYLPPGQFLNLYKKDPYSGEIAYVDSELGKLMSFLKENQLRNNTLIILTGDHGEAFGEHGEERHGYFAYNTTLWIPLIITGPGIKTIQVEEDVCHIDIFPTVCDLLGNSRPAFLQGISLMPLMKGEKIKNRPIYFESLDPYYNSGYAPLRGFIEKQKKFIDSPLPEFYDLKNDFAETQNLIKHVRLGQYRLQLKNIMGGLAASGTKQKPVIDHAAQEKLRSLGYISATIPSKKQHYGPEDDLKTMLPIQQKMNEALDLFAAGDIENSQQLFLAVIREKPALAFAYILLATLYESQGKLQEASDILASGFEQNPQSYDLVLQYGIRLVKSGELDKGITILKQARDMLDFDPDVWINLGIAYRNKGDFSQALDSFKKALSLNTTNAIIYNNMGVLYFSIFQQTHQRNDSSKAAEYLKKAIELDPSMASAYNTLGILNQISGNLDKALLLWEKSVKLDPDFAFPVYNLGIAYLKKGNKPLALKYFLKYLDMSGKKISSEERHQVEAYIQQCRKK